MRRTTAANLALAVFVTSATLVVSDVVLRATLHVPVDFLRAIVRKDPRALPTKGLKPGLGVRLTGEFGEYSFRLHTDGDGYRMTVPKLGPPYDLIFLGDSQTAGTGMDDDATIPSFVAGELRRPTLNAACYGYSNVEEWLVAKNVLSEYSPKDVVLGFYAGNDPYENFTHRRLLSGEAALPDGSSPKGALDAAKQWLVQRSSIYNLLIRLRKQPVLNEALYRANLLKEAPPKELVVYKKGESALKSAFWNATEEALLKMKAECDAHGARFHVVNLPDRILVDADYWAAWVRKYRLDPSAYDLRGPAARLGAFCAANGIDYLDLDDAFLKEAASGRRLYWKLDLHLDTEGNRVAAREISSHLK